MPLYIRQRPINWRSDLRLRNVLIAIIFLALIIVTNVVHNTWCAVVSTWALRDFNHRYPNLKRDFYPILVPTYTRPEFLEQVLKGLEKVNDIEKTVLIVSQDGSHPEVTNLIKNIKIPSKVVYLKHIRPFWSLPSLVHVNEYATSANVRFLLSFAFDYLEAPAAIILESDLVPSVDFYNYFEWSFAHFFGLTSTTENIDPSPYSRYILGVNAFNFDSKPNSPPYSVELGRFSVSGWGTGRSRWKLLNSNWAFYGLWDFRVQHIRITEGLYFVHPLLSRVKNIGMKGENFNIEDPNEIKRWHSVYISEEPINYRGIKPTVERLVNDTRP